MSNPFIKSVGQGASDMAKKIAKQVVSESFEVAKDVKNKALGQEAQFDVPQEGGQTIPDISEKLDEEEIKAKDTIRLGDLSGEVQRLIKERKQKEEEWKKEQEEKMRVNEKEEQDKRMLNQPVTKKKRGFMGGMKGKQGTKEISKSPSG